MTLRVKTTPVLLNGNRELIAVRRWHNMGGERDKIRQAVAVVQPLDATADARTREILIEARRRGAIQLDCSASAITARDYGRRSTSCLRFEGSSGWRPAGRMARPPASASSLAEAGGGRCPWR